MSPSKKNDFAASVHLSEAPSSLRFLFGVVQQFCRFCIWSDTECKTPAENGLQAEPHIPSLTHYIQYVQYAYSPREEGEGWEAEVEPERRGEGQQERVQNTKLG
jgi:hypothetical protein